jgi:hypothetical protein
MRRRRRSRRNGVVRGATSEPITSPGRIGGRESIRGEPRRASGSNHRGGISPSRILKTRLPLDQNGHLYRSCAPVRVCALASRALWGARRNSLGLRLMASERSRSGRPMARRRVPGLSRIASDAAAACWSTAYGLPVHKRGGARAGIYALVCQDGQTPPLNGRIQNSLPTAPANRIR